MYHRATNTPLPAHLPEDHPDFLAAYFEAEVGLKPKAEPKHVVVNSVQHVVSRYMASNDFKKLSESYQDVRRRDMNRLCCQKDGAIGKVPFNRIESRHIKADMGALSPNPANERLKTWRALFKFATYAEIVAEDVTTGIQKVSTPSTQGHIPWTFAEIEKFRARWTYGTEQRAAFETIFWCGCRMSDAVGLGPKNIDAEGWINFIQQKTKSDVSVPLYRDLPDFAVPEDRDHLLRALEAMGDGRMFFIQTIFGQQRSRKAASSWFSEAATEATLPEDRSSHGLRKSRMILHAERGATTHQIAAWSGHESLKEVERYTKRVNRRRLLTPSPSVLETGEFF